MMLVARLMQTSPTEQDILSNAPALRPPPGVVPNFENPPNKNYLGIVTNLACLIITATLMSLRIYTKVYCQKKVHVEDYIGALAWVFLICCIACDVWIVSFHGIFVHQWNFHIKDLSKFFFILHVGSNLSSVTIALIKGAILLDWIRIFVPLNARNFFFWTSAVVLTLQCTFSIVMIAVENLSCIPHQKIWDLSILWGACINFHALYIPAASINLFADVVILALPQKEIWSLKMSNKNKIGASLVFMIGIFTCICAGFRVHASDMYYHSEDRSYTAAAMYLWSLVEITCLFLVFCVPTIPRAFARMKSGEKMGKNPSSRSQNTTREICSSRSSLQLRTIDRPPSSGVYQPQEPNNIKDSPFPRTPSGRSDRGPITEITAGKHGDHVPQQEVPFGIMCTTQITTEITTREDLEREENAGEGHDRYQWPSMHMH